MKILVASIVGLWLGSFGDANGHTLSFAPTEDAGAAEPEPDAPGASEPEPSEPQETPTNGATNGADGEEAPADGPAEKIEAPPAQPEATPASPEQPSEPKAWDEDDVDGPAVLETVLPSGLRVRVARDDSLPVAAVVLAVETGTEDDPDEFPGLIHALAFQLLQGNRELAPGGASARVTDAGGLATLAVGPAQVRFESLVPVSALDEAIWIESQRLRSPTVNMPLWTQALSWARRDPTRRWSVPRPVLAAAHGAPGLAHDGRQAPPALASLSPEAVAAQLSDRFSYDRATLVVVAPGSIRDTFEAIRPHFAELTPRSPEIRDRDLPSPADGNPRSIEAPGGDGSVFAWPLPPGQLDQTWARVWCKVLNRQRAATNDPPKSRVRCTLDRDPRRALFIVRVQGTSDPIALLESRLERIASGSDRPLMDRQRAVVERELRSTLRTPLSLARHLSELPPRLREAQPLASLPQVTGLDSLGQLDRAPDVSRLLGLGRAVRWMPAPEGGS